MEVMLKLHVYNGFGNSNLPPTPSKLIVFRIYFIFLILIVFKLMRDLKITQILEAHILKNFCYAENNYVFINHLSQNGKSQNKLFLIPFIINSTTVI